MLRLIKAELYKTFNRAYYYIFLACTTVFIVSIIAAIYLSKSRVTVFEMMSMGLNFLSTPVFLILMIVSTVTNEEIKEKTLRNTVSFGLSRNKLYMAKIITSVILSFIAAAVILGAYIGSSAILLDPGSRLTSTFINGFVLRLLSAIPMYTASIAICAILGFSIKNEMLYAFTYAGLFVAVKPIIQIACYLVSDKLVYVYNALITTQLSNLGSMNTTGTDMLRTAGLGLAYTAFFIAAGIIIFRRQEIK